MTCPRCQGLLVPTWMVDESRTIEVLRCINCGFHTPEPPNEDEAVNAGRLALAAGRTAAKSIAVL
jgi:Zn ribbon nucleic-acid-binding protein